MIRAIKWLWPKGALEGCLILKWLGPIRYRGVGRVCFLPPLFCPTKFVKSSDQFFERKARRRRKNFEVPFFKKLTFLGKFYGFYRFLTVFLRFSVAPQRKKPAAGKKFGNPFFCAPEAREKFSDPFFIFVRPDFHFGPIPPLKKFGDDVCLVHWMLLAFHTFRHSWHNL